MLPSPQSSPARSPGLLGLEKGVKENCLRLRRILRQVSLENLYLSNAIRSHMPYEVRQSLFSLEKDLGST